MQVNNVIKLFLFKLGANLINFLGESMQSMDGKDDAVGRLQISPSAQNVSQHLVRSLMTE
jgi:hypothetical protein